MSHEFVIIDESNKQQTYARWEDIPLSFRNVIKFLPDVPDGPHTAEQHTEMEQWKDKFKTLMKRETN